MWDTRTYFDWSLKGGTARGGLPIDNYFLLGVDTQPTNLLRGHRTTKDGKYGNGPMGTDFVLLNTDVERKLATVQSSDMRSVGTAEMSSASVQEPSRRRAVLHRCSLGEPV